MFHAIRFTTGRSNRASAVLALALLASLATAPGCGSDEKKPGSVEFNLAGSEGDKLSEKNRQDLINQLNDIYNLRVVEDDKSYDSEGRNNRVLRLLGGKKDDLKDQLKNVIELHIGSDFSTSEVTQGKLAVTLDADASEQEILDFISKSHDKFQVSTSLHELGSRTGVKAFRDLKGMSEGEAGTFSKNFQEAVKGFDFSVPYAAKFATEVRVERKFALGKSSVIVPFDAPSDALRNFFSDVLALSKHLNEDLATLSTLLGVSVNFQADTLMPRELDQGIRNLTGAKDVFRTEGRVKKTIKIGRRTEEDAYLAKTNDVLLVSFNASVLEISRALDMLGLDLDAVFAATWSDANQKYTAYGVTFDISSSDLQQIYAPKELALQKAKEFVSKLLSVARPDRLQRIKVSRVAQSTSTAIEKNYDGVATLRVDVQGFDATTVERVLSDYEASFDSAARLQVQKDMLEGLRSQGYSSNYISFTYSDSTLDASSAEKTQRLQKTASYFATVAPATRLYKDGVSQVKFEKGSLSDLESVLLIGNTLKIDPYRATADLLEIVLRQKEAPAPSPAADSKPSNKQ